LKIAGQEHPDRHRPAEDIKQWMAPAVDTQLNQLFHTQFHQISPSSLLCQAGSSDSVLSKPPRTGLPLLDATSHHIRDDR